MSIRQRVIDWLGNEVSATDADAKAFSDKAKALNLLIVPADSFGCPGYFRMAYCIETEKVRRSFAALEKFVAEEYGVTKH